jgi:hypothetical protein
MTSLAIRWTNKKSKNYVDILPKSLFRFEIRSKDIEHVIRRPNGTTYSVKCKIDVNKTAATLTYRESDNRPNSLWPGVTRITFKTSQRKQIRLVEWQDEGDTKFVNPSPTWSTEHDSTSSPQFFVIKTDTVEVKTKSLSLFSRPITKMNGAGIALGDLVFVWVFENGGGRGIEWHGTVHSLDKRQSDVYRIQLRNLQPASSSFGTKEIDGFASSEIAAEKGLLKKLKEYSHAGIRRIEKHEAGVLLALFASNTYENEGKNEITRLLRLGSIASRPSQAIFSANVRRAYKGKCAITGCETSEVLEAAHIKVVEGADDNDLRNGILLRADIHALFDRGLIALTLDANRICAKNFRIHHMGFCGRPRCRIRGAAALRR